MSAPGGSGWHDVEHAISPTGPLRPEDISLIRRWIEEGAEWPDALANEADVPPPDPRAIALVEVKGLVNSAALVDFAFTVVQSRTPISPSQPIVPPAHGDRSRLSAG